MSKLTFTQALQALAEDRPLRAVEVSARALQCYVWVQSNGLPGCLSDNYGVYTSKRDAVAECLLMADIGEGAPRGLLAQLRRPGHTVAASVDGYVYRVQRHRLADLLLA
jgi:hypothetical protein